MEGIGWYSHELLRRMVLKHPEHQFYFFFDRPYDPAFIYAENVIPVVLFPPTRHVFLIAYWFDVSLRKALKKIKADIFFSPDSIGLSRPVCKTVSTIHDVNFITNPKNFAFLLRWFYSSRTPLLANASDIIVTVSEYSKQEIIRLLNVKSGKVRVVYNACRPGFGPVSEDVRKAVRLKYTEGKEYFVFIGGLYHRKNLVRLVEAFEIFKNKNRSEIKLVIVGKAGAEARPLFRKIDTSPWKKDIVVTGRISDDDEVKNILSSALALTYVSVLEGFGMPMVEAMKSGVPVLASSSSCMPEVGGNAALYANPYDVADIANKMTEMYNNDGLRLNLTENAGIQLQKFDWDQSAEKLWQIFEEVMKQPSLS